MRNMFLAFGRLGITLGALVLAGLALAGCGGGEATPAASIGLTPRANSILFEFTGHGSPKNGTLTTQLAHATSFGPDLQPESIDSLVLDQYGGSGTPPANIVDLVTNSCTDNYPSEDTFVCSVTLRQFYTRSFANTFVQVVSIESDSGTDISSTHEANNSYTGDTYGLSGTDGIWQYTADEYATLYPDDPTYGGYAGVLTQSPYNTGTQTWSFLNPDDADTNYTFAIWASKGYSSYTQGFGNFGYTSACSGGTAITLTNKKGITVPFDFTLYGTNSSTVNIAYNGQITLGSTTLTSSGPVDLATTNLSSAATPVFFAFWDVTKYASGGQMCYQTIGTAPTRQFVVEWDGLTFSSGNEAGTASLDFEAYLYEGTGEIDTFYNNMSCSSGCTSGRETGAQAEVGMQGASGTTAFSDYHDDGGYGTGTANAYIPSP